MDYNEEIRKIREEFPLGKIENPLPFALLIERTNVGNETYTSKMRNRGIVRDYRYSRMREYEAIQLEKDKTTDKPDTSSESILKIINKAKENGWDVPDVLNNGDDIAIEKFKMMKMYLDHDFAKAFWGEKMIDTMIANFPIYQTSYKFHLQQMVLKENPIYYLKKIG